MTQHRILLTGASGCLGHYIAEALMYETDAELFLLVRTPSKFQLPVRPGVTLLSGDLREIAQFHDLLQTINCAILAATAWGGPEIYEVNVNKILELISD